MRYRHRKYICYQDPILKRHCKEFLIRYSSGEIFSINGEISCSYLDNPAARISLSSDKKGISFLDNYENAPVNVYIHMLHDLTVSQVCSVVLWLTFIFIESALAKAGAIDYVAIDLCT
jgi:hypothetical protein